MSIKEGLDKVGQEDCDNNQENAINSEDIQTSVVADRREVKRRVSIQDTLWEKEEDIYNDEKMTRKCKLID